jgi:hypothetical protein
VLRKPLEVISQLPGILGQGPIRRNLIQAYGCTVQAAESREAQPAAVRLLPRLDEGAFDSTHLEHYVIGELEVDAELRVGSRPKLLDHSLVQ